MQVGYGLNSDFIDQKRQTICEKITTSISDVLMMSVYVLIMNSRYFCTTKTKLSQKFGL